MSAEISMHDPRIDKLAQVLVKYSVAVKKGDIVAIVGTPLAEPAIVATYREVLKAGGNPWVRIAPESCGEILLKFGKPEQLSTPPPFEKPHHVGHERADRHFPGVRTRAR